MKRKKNVKNKKNYNQSRLSLFQKSDIKFSKSCPLSGKNAPELDYKNIKVRMMQYSHHKMNRYESCNKRNDCCH